jgi:serine/threonine-protein kinase
MIGQTISHYEILEELGGGGMGMVYKAEDTKLRRIVALKFLSPDLTREEGSKTRLIHEARAASALQHNNICAIHEIDETSDGRLFISMDFYQGETLKEKINKGPLPVEEAIDITLQVAAGLVEAHGAGMVHRDIKPANIMVTAKGVVKILDFGLAKLTGQTKVTRTGTTVGTAAYMSPEQARGDETDARSDIWSLGVMLYEMLTGRLPFRGDVEPAVLYSIMHEDPVPVTTARGDVPISLEDIVEKALAKERTKRYATMEEIAIDLEKQRDQIAMGIKERRVKAIRTLKRRRRLSVGTVIVLTLVAAAVLVQMLQTRRTAIDSIAVLPFVNLSGGEDQGYFLDGMTDALINELGQISALRVISRTSVMRFKDTDTPLPEIARELDVDAIIEASVLRSEDQVRITAQLIRANPERQLWAESYVRDARDVLGLHSEIAQAIAHEIQATLTPQEQARMASIRPVVPEAYDLYLRGLYQSDKSTREGAEKAIDYFGQAIAVDSNYAEAYAMLANSYLFLSYLGGLSQEEARSQAGPLLEKALAIDDALPEAHYVLAGVKHFFDWSWAGAESSYKRAIALDPTFVGAHSDYAFLLMALGRIEESIAQAERAVQLDPLSYMPNLTLAYAYNSARRYDQAIALYRRMAELEPRDYRPHQRLMFQYERLGRYQDAIKARQLSMTLQGYSSEEVAATVAALDSVYSESGPEGYWRWHLKELNGGYDRQMYVVARYYTYLGEIDEAFACLEKAYHQRDPFLHMLSFSSSWDPLRDDPRYQDLLRRMNLRE